MGIAEVWMTPPVCCNCDQKLVGEDLDLTVLTGRCALCDCDITVKNGVMSEEMKGHLNVGGDMSWYCHEDRTPTERLAYLRGLTSGYQNYAWWKDGTQWVGSCGTRLQTVLLTISKELERLKNLAVKTGENQ